MAPFAIFCVFTDKKSSENFFMDTSWSGFFMIVLSVMDSSTSLCTDV